MKYLKLFEEYKAVINKKSLYRDVKDIGYIKMPVEIRINIEKASHVGDRQIRHFVGDELKKITDDDIVETIELSIEELSIALMQGRFNINQEKDNYPTKGVRGGEPNRFLIRNLNNNLNVVCELIPGDNEFTLIVVTVMVKNNFLPYRGQFVIDVK